MIFIGAELSDPYSHFVTNIVSSIGNGDDLLIDLLDIHDSETIFHDIFNHLKKHDEKFVIYNAYTDEDFFLTFRSHFPQLKLITVFSDDEWRHFNYDRYVALYSDLFTIAVKEHLVCYENYGLKPFYMQWACNPEMFHPLKDVEKDIDVSFIGAAYGNRIKYVQFLIASGIHVKVFGKGWDKFSGTRECWGGYLSNEEMIHVIARSKINLNFLWTSADKERCTIKARTLELSACQAFQLSNFTHEFSNYGFDDGENIAVFEDEESALKKIRFYLANDDKREAIASQAYQYVLKNHTWEQRFHSIFNRLNHQAESNEPVHLKSCVLVVVNAGVQHCIDVQDKRLSIQIIESSGQWMQGVESMDGVIFLKHDSTINNETLNMMVFGLKVDNTDMIVANFSVGGVTNRYWIRMVDQMLEKKWSLMRRLPNECFMFSGNYIYEGGNQSGYDLNAKISYIEHPSFWLELPYWMVRYLRLYFADHGDSRLQFKKYLNKNSYFKAFSLCIDKAWQKIVMTGV